MTTINQLVRHGRETDTIKSKSPALQGGPQIPPPQGLVNDFIMPIVNAVAPTKAWQELRFPSSGPVQFTYGHFLSVLLKFLIVGLICWRLTMALIKPPKADEKPATRECPFCRQAIDARATRCAYCTSQLVAA